MVNLLIALSITKLPVATDVKIYWQDEDMYNVVLRKFPGFQIQIKVDGRQDAVAISNRLDKELENVHAFD